MFQMCIALAASLFAFLIIDTIAVALAGDYGKGKQLATHLRHLKGENYRKETRRFSKVIAGKIEDSLMRKYLMYTVPVCIILFILAFAAFKSLGLSAAISLLGLALPKVLIMNRKNKLDELMELQLRDAMHSIIASLKAGLSINSALIKCSAELERIYAGQKEKPMLEEFIKIKNDLNTGLPVDDALMHFKKRVKLDDVDDFVTSIVTVRQKGGNLAEVMGSTANMISDKIAIKMDIKRMVSGKKVEAKILTFIPVFIVTGLSIFSPEYMKPLYGSFEGRIVIFIGFALLIINYFIGRRIVDIRV